MTIIGIDLGTTNSCVAIMDGKEPKVIENVRLPHAKPLPAGPDRMPRARAQSQK